MIGRLVKMTVTASAALALVSSAVTHAAPRDLGIKNIVFVHGAWADGSSWSKFIPVLEARRFHTVAVQNPLTPLADDVAATRPCDCQSGTCAC